MGKTTIKINGMSCGNCVNTIEKALQQLSGVEKATVNLKRGIAKIKYDDSIQTLDKLTDIIHDVGYETELVK